MPSLVALGRLQIELNKPILAEHYLVEATHLKVLFLARLICVRIQIEAVVTNLIVASFSLGLN